jgi:hypothetical protein
MGMNTMVVGGGAKFFSKCGRHRLLRLVEVTVVAEAMAVGMGCRVCGTRLAKCGDTAAQCDTLEHLVEEDDYEEGDEAAVAGNNEGETDHWGMVSLCPRTSSRAHLRSEWKITPASRTAILTISGLACEAFAEPPGDSMLDAELLDPCHCTMRIPMYSTRNDKNRPAMRMAEAVASYASSPRHSLANISEA